MNTGSVAGVAVCTATYHIDKLYDYLIPGDLVASVVPGMRVRIPFGKGNRQVEGVILTVASKGCIDNLKSIDSLVDSEPIFDDENIRLALWMRDRFFCTVYDALRCMIPTKTSFKRKIKGRQYPDADAVKAAEITLNSEQAEAYSAILPLLHSDTPKAALLYGVTGSGKTVIFISLIKDALALGKTAIVLVPEIALTPQTVSLFESHFSSSVAVLHSALNNGERYAEWSRIRNGEVSVVIGTRSAVFAPLKNIGLIVIDEEQEHTYKSENSPRYHAREVAKYRVTKSNGLLLLASATPSVNSMYAAQKGKYELLRLQSRFNEMDLPSVIVTDMKQELRGGNSGQISDMLRCELTINIQSGQQSILFINRRGANPIVVCPECGYTCKCRNCSVSMTYHISNKKLLCHHCGYSLPVYDACPECGGKLNFMGAGTQKVELELSKLFPEATILRMDADTTTGKDSHDKLLSEFREKEINILLGTQMVTKGLDFENVTLVGVLSADQSLYMSDYRANERTFSLITQVIGRSGRGRMPGRAIIQTFTPENRVIKLASQQDYDSFYKSEIAFRQALKSPPVRDLFSLTALGIKEYNVSVACNLLKDMLQRYFRGDASITILGPAPAPVARVNNRYVYKLMVNCVNSKKIRDTISHVIREFARSKESRGVSVYADMEY